MNEYYKKDLYAILGVSSDADDAKIKSAYRKQARIWHPDVNDNSPESILRFKEITEAYEVLTDSQKRSQYDILKGFNTYKKERTYTSSSQAQKAYSEANSKNTSYEKSSATAEKIKDEYVKSTPHSSEKKENSSFSSVFENILDGLFTSDPSKSKKDSKKKAKPENGRDINLNVVIKLSEAISGTHRTINVLHSERCPKCEGRRFINGAKCPLCKGTGEVSTHKKLNVKIPAGVKKGAKIRIASEGNKGYNGGKNGDLYLFIDIEKNTFFQFEEYNVLCEIPITPYEAALGATIEVPTMSGCVSMKIPANTTTGQKFRLSGQGLQNPKSNIKGDQIVTVKISMPKEITEAERKLYEQLKEVSNHKIRENLLDD